MEAPLIILLAVIIVAPPLLTGTAFATTSEDEENKDNDRERETYKDAITLNYDKDTCVYDLEGWPVWPYTEQCPDVVRTPDADPPGA